VLCCFVFVRYSRHTFVRQPRGPGVVSIQGVEVSAGETGYPLGFPDNTIDGDGPRGPASRLPRAGYSAAEEERGRTGHRSAQRGGGPISRPQ